MVGGTKVQMRRNSVGINPKSELEQVRRAGVLAVCGSVLWGHGRLAVGTTNCELMCCLSVLLKISSRVVLMDCHAQN